MSSDEAGAPDGRLDSPVPSGEPDGESDDAQRPAPVAELPDLSEIRFADVIRARQTSPLPTPYAAAANLPIDKLDPEVLERLAAEMIKRRPNRGAHFYGRRGQKQYGLDIVEREAAGANSVYQVRRYEVLTPEDISNAVKEYADPQPSEPGGEKPVRRFEAGRYVLFTSAEFEREAALQDRLEALQQQYDGDLIIEVWGREMISGLLRDSGALVSSVFGPEWARVFSGFAPPSPGPADPDPLGLVESPVQVLNLDAIAEDAKACETTDPLESARLYGILASTLAEANFPSHAAAQRLKQADRLRAGGDSAGAFTVLFDQARADFTASATSMLGQVQHGLEELKPDLDELQTAKLDVLSAAQSWYEHGSQLAVAVPALENIKAAGDPDTPFLACTVLKQALVDGWFDFDPPHSLVTPGGINADLLNRLRQCASGLASSDVVIRARLACALADASLAANASPTDTEAAFMPTVQAAGAGRYLHAGGLVFARAARAFAMHGDTAHAIDLWRQAILRSSESRLYGDVLGCRRALNAAILEQPVPAFAELAPAGMLPNADRLLAASQSAELDALRAAHAGKLPDAFAETRRHQWEARLSGHLTDEREALELFGDVLLAAKHPDVAVTAWVMGGRALKASQLARALPAAVDVEPWVRSPARASQAAAAQVIGVQGRLYGPAADEVVQLLLGLTTGLWSEPRIAPTPALDAVNALSRFGRDLPANAVDPVLDLLQPRLTAGVALTPETTELLMQLYWAVPGSRDDLAAVIGPQLALGDPPPGLWEMTGNLPEQARGPVTAAVTSLAEAGSIEALRTLAHWHHPTPAVQLAARRTCARLLREPANGPSVTWSVTTRFRDAVMLLEALASADPPEEVDPRQLQPGIGPIVTEKTMLSAMLSVGGAPTVATAGALSAGQEQAEAASSEEVGIDSGSAAPGHPATEAVDSKPADSTPAAQPDAQARIAAGPPAELAAALAEHLLAVVESHNPPAFYRADAVAALHSLLGQLAPDVNSRIAGRLLAIAENPGLNTYDRFELSSQHPLSRGRLNIGARSLPALALVTAATAAALAADQDPEVERPADQTTQSMIKQAVQLLHSPDQKAAKHGATVLALVPKFEPSLARYADALIVHPSVEVRTIAASMGTLDESAQRILTADSAPQVRAALASRSKELADDLVARFRADDHPDVKRALAAHPEPDNGKPA